MARDVQDAQVPRRPWMAESSPDRIDSDRLRAIFTLRGALRVSKTLTRFIEPVTPAFGV